jgi:hypothetical protein
MDFRELGYEVCPGLDSILGPPAGCCEHGNEPQVPIYDVEFSIS